MRVRLCPPSIIVVRRATGDSRRLHVGRRGRGRFAARSSAKRLGGLTSVEVALPTAVPTASRSSTTQPTYHGVRGHCRGDAERNRTRASPHWGPRSRPRRARGAVPTSGRPGGRLQCQRHWPAGPRLRLSAARARLRPRPIDGRPFAPAKADGMSPDHPRHPGWRLRQAPVAAVAREHAQAVRAAAGQQSTFQQTLERVARPAACSTGR